MLFSFHGKTEQRIDGILHRDSWKEFYTEKIFHSLGKVLNEIFDKHFYLLVESRGGSLVINSYIITDLRKISIHQVL